VDSDCSDGLFSLMRLDFLDGSVAPDTSCGGSGSIFDVDAPPDVVPSCCVRGEMGSPPPSVVGFCDVPLDGVGAGPGVPKFEFDVEAASAISLDDCIGVDIGLVDDGGAADNCEPADDGLDIGLDIGLSPDDGNCGAVPPPGNALGMPSGGSSPPAWPAGAPGFAFCSPAPLCTSINIRSFSL